MARRTVIVLSCDLCDKPDDDAEVATLAFGHAGRSYDLDLCAAHTTQVHDTLAGWATKGRAARAGTGRQSRRPADTPSRRRTSTTATTDTDRIRRWARQNGHHVPDRGPLPAAVITAHTAAHPDSGMSTQGLASGAGVEV